MLCAENGMWSREWHFNEAKFLSHPSASVGPGGWIKPAEVSQEQDPGGKLAKNTRVSKHDAIIM